MVFFSKNKKTAMEKVKEISKREATYKGKIPMLAENQMPHISGWKTWKLVPKKR